MVSQTVQLILLKDCNTSKSELEVLSENVGIGIRLYMLTFGARIIQCLGLLLVTTNV
jgi:hypothetical protein